MKVLELEVQDSNKIFEVITALEEVKEGYKEKRSVKLDDGWKLSLSRRVGDDILKTALSVRLANYIYDIKIVELLYYPQIEYLVRQGQEELKEASVTVKSGSLFLIKNQDKFLISDGIDEWEIDEYERKVVAYAIRRLWYLRTENFFITNTKATFREIPIKEPVKFYLLMEV